MKRYNILVELAVIVAVAFIVGLTSCDLDTPSKPTHSSQWDPLNPNPPAAPQIVGVEVLSETEVWLQWTDNSGNEDSFIVYRKLAGEEDFTILKTLPANPDTVRLQQATLDECPVNTAMQFIVSAANEAGETRAEVLVNAHTGHVAPTAPANLAVMVPAYNQVMLSWEDQSANEDTFVVVSALDEEFSSPAVVAMTQSDSLSVLLTIDDPFNTYYYKVRAQNIFGVSEDSSFVVATPGAFPLDTPVNLIAQPVSESEIFLSWGTAPENAQGLEVFFSVDDTLNFTSILSLFPSDTSATVESLLANSTYHFKIRYFNIFNTSSFSEIVAGSTSDGIPAAPSIISLTLDNEADVILKWEDRSQIEIGYIIEQSVGTEDNYHIMGEVDEDVLEMRFDNCELFAEHFYRVKAVGSHEASAYSIVRSVTPGEMEPNAPILQGCDLVGISDVRLTWSDNSRIETHFSIHERLSTGDWAEVGVAQENGTSSLVTDRLPYQTYLYRVRAENDYGESAWGNSLSITIPGAPPMPQNFSAYGYSENQIQLVWRDVADDEDGFIVQESINGMEEFATIDTLVADRQIIILDREQRFTKHYYRVCAFNEFGDSDWTAVDSATVLSRVAFVAATNSGLLTIDITDPTDPVQIGSWDTGALASRLKIRGDYAYVADSYGGVRVIDIRDPQVLKEVGYFDTDGRARGLDVVQDKAYVADGSSGFVVLNVSDPYNPTFDNSLRYEDFDLQDVVVQGSYAYIAAESGGLSVVEIPDHGFLEEVASIEFPDAAYGVAISEDYAYVAAYSSGLRICDISNPATTHEVGNYDDLNNAIDVFVEENKAYVADFWNGLRIIDITNRANPTEVGFIVTPDQAWGVWKEGNIVLVAANDAGLRVIDVEFPSSPSEIGALITPDPARAVAVKVYE